ncbi:MAG: hypothetical protein ACNA8W_18570 [Bradymonadaceae bacterium]
MTPSPKEVLDVTPLLDFARAPLLGARLRWHLGRYTTHRDGGDFKAATGDLEKAADLFFSHDVPPRAWAFLLSAIVWTAAVGDTWPHIRATFRKYQQRAWPADGDYRALWEAFSRLPTDCPEGPAVDIAEELISLFPRSALGPYISAHFSEKMYGRTRTWTPDHVRSISARFEKAERLATQSGMERLATHARQRRGVLMLYLGYGRDEGRKILHSVSPAELSPNERLWYAFGMLHSPFWLDRVRSADVLDELAEALNTGPLGYEKTVDVDTLRRTAANLVHLAPLKLEAAEEDRLRALTKTLFAPPLSSSWKALIDVRKELDDLRDAPITRAEEAYPILDTLARSSAGGWADAFAHFTQLATTWNNHAQTGSLERPIEEGPFKVGAHITQILDALTTDDRAAIERGLRALRDELRGADNIADPAPLKPIALLWPRLLSIIGSEDRIDTLVEEVAALWAAAAPAPSYGWWPLAAHFIKADLPGPARHIARRALGDSPASGTPVEDFVLARVLEHIIEVGEADEMRYWLEVVRDRNE